MLLLRYTVGVCVPFYSNGIKAAQAHRLRHRLWEEFSFLFNNAKALESGLGFCTKRSVFAVAPASRGSRQLPLGLAVGVPRAACGT